MCQRKPLNTIPSCSFNVQLLSLSQSNCEERLASSYQSVRIEESDSHQMDFREISFLEFLLEFVDSFRFYFKWNKNKERYVKTCLCIRSPIVSVFTVIISGVLYEVSDGMQKQMNYFLLPKITLYLRPRPSVCMWSRARILNLFTFPWNPIHKHFTRVNIVKIISVDSSN
jgi:hypothetical protein